MRVAILHNAVPADAPPEDQDTLVQVEAVAGALAAWATSRRPVACTLDLAAHAGGTVAAAAGRGLQPGRIAGRGRFAGLPPPGGAGHAGHALYRQPHGSAVPDHAQDAGQGADAAGGIAHAGVDGSAGSTGCHEQCTSASECGEVADCATSSTSSHSGRGVLRGSSRASGTRARAAWTTTPCSATLGRRSCSGGWRDGGAIGPALLRRTVHRGPGVQPGGVGRSSRARVAPAGRNRLLRLSARQAAHRRPSGEMA